MQPSDATEKLLQHQIIHWNGVQDIRNTEMHNRSIVRVLIFFMCLSVIAIIYTFPGESIPSQKVHCHEFQEVHFNNNASPVNRRLSAYYQCYSRPKSVTKVLDTVRTFYPDMRIVMYNDGGNRFLQRIAANYGAEYYYGRKSSTRVTQLFFKCADHAKEFFQRILEMARLGTGDDWILLLEDDVRVLKRIDIHGLKYDLNGVYDLNHLRPCFVRVIESVIRKKMYHDFFGCAGGCILRGEFLRNITRANKWKGMIDMLHDADVEIASDEMISALTYMHRGSLGQYHGYSSTDWWEYILWRRWTDTIEVLHGDKSSYD